jgi:restriction endonuclease S subunit
MTSRGDIEKNNIQPILSEEWIKFDLDEVLEKAGAFTKLKSSDYFESGNFPVVDQGDKFISGFVIDEKLLYQGELPVIIFGDHTRIVKYIDFKFAAGADGTKILKPFAFYDSKFFYYYFRSLQIPSLGYSRHFKILKSIKFPLPPKPEQERIVAKLDLLFADIERVKEGLAKIPVLMKNFRQAVLTQAVTGKLTEEWRVGKGLGEWKLERADVCCEKVQSGGTPKADGFGETGIPFLKVYNIVNDKIDFDYRPQFITEEAHNTKCKKSIGLAGDVLMNIVGPPMNKVAILPTVFKEWNINQAITLFRPKGYLDNIFLFYFFQEGTSVRSVTNETRGVVGQVNISLSQCRAFEIPIPPIKEQQEIVHRIEALFAQADTIEARYEVLKEKIEQLPQAILAKAFRGELVPQLPTDGDARELLAEIKKMKEGMKKGKEKGKELSKSVIF